MSLAILGCGPAGLLAAHAAVRQGCRPTIFSVKKKSPHGGAQYLHKPIPGLTDMDPDMILRYVKVGTAEGYASKVYGDPTVPVSWDRFQEGQVPAWDMGKVYDQLWDEYENLIVDRHLDPAAAEQIMAGFGQVMNTIPLHALCRFETGHTFHKQDILLSDTAQVKMKNVIVYNGQPTERWYRTSCIGDTEWTEYAVHGEAEYGGLTSLAGSHAELGYKPTHTDCDCHPGMHRLGRFGKWQRTVLSHEAYDEAVDIVRQSGLAVA